MAKDEWVREGEAKRNESEGMNQGTNVISFVKSRDRWRSWQGWRRNGLNVSFSKSKIHVERSSTKSSQILVSVVSKSV